MEKAVKNVVINYTTFRRDYEWLKYSLESYAKFATGFSGITIVVPTVDLDMFLPFEKKYSRPDAPVFIKNFLEQPGKGFVHHLAMKCYADVFNPAATHVLHMDPDCLFSGPVTPDDYFIDEKPILLYEYYDDIKRASEEKKYNVGESHRYLWKAVTESAVKFPCEVETMCRHPAIHPAFIYKATRELIEANHHTPFIDFVIKQKNQYPQGFGEFNTLGAVAWQTYRDCYSWHRTGHYVEYPKVPDKVCSLRSHDGVNHYMAKIKDILK